VWVIESADGDYQVLPRANWSNADVLNSPKLTRLLEGLAIETKDLLDEIEPLTLPESFDDTQDATRMDIVAWSDLTLNSPQVHSTILLNDGDTSLTGPTFSRESTNKLVRPQSNQTTLKEFKYFGQDVFVPSGALLERPPSLLNELAIFPPTSKPPRTFQSSLTLARCRQNFYNQLYRKLNVLKRAGVGESDPIRLNLINQLADVTYSSGKTLEANSLYRQFLASQGRNLMTAPEKVLHAQVGLIDGLCRAGHPLEAKEMLARVTAVMEKRFSPTHVIFRRLLKAKIEIFNWMEDWDREAPVARDLVQLCLVHLGPKDPETLNAIFRLGSVMMGQKHFSESARLHQLTIQLCQEGTEKHHERKCWSSTSLARVYEADGKLDDAIQLLRESNRRAKESLGHENEAVMIGDYRLARILAKRGLLQESEELLRDTLARQTRVLGEAHINTLCTVFDLGYTLQLEKRYPEAAACLEKCFHKSLGLSNFKFMTRFCTQLGCCYEDQGRHEVALAYYHQAIEFLCSAKVKSNDELFDVGQYVAEIQGLIHRARRNT
jgi:tetratricopeptide (TPR) repeat protein